MQLVNSTEGAFRLNKFASLKRWTKDAINNDVDKLELRFDTLNDICIKGLSNVSITARDYDGIISECNEAITRYFQEATKQITNDLSAGYWMGNDSWYHFE